MEIQSPFLKNAWYAACWSADIGHGEMFHRKLLNEDVVFYRRSDGVAVALQDRCAHRFVPLHLGKLDGDNIECCYHGLVFDCTGRCVKNPHGDGRIPAAARVRSFPVLERHGIAWIWMGGREPDASFLPDFRMLDEGSGYSVKRGGIRIDASYVLMGENLLDLSHVAYLHEGLLGHRDMVASLPRVRQEGRVVHVDRLMENVKVPAIMDMLFRRDGQPVDIWQNVQWTPPCSFLIDSGAKEPGKDREASGWYYGIHLLTPETETTTHYHFASARPASADTDAETDAELLRLRRIAFEEQDKPIVNAQQAAIGRADFWELKPVLLAIDAGPVRLRRTMEELIAQERAQDARGA